MRASIVVGLLAVGLPAYAAPPASAPLPLGSSKLEEESDIDGDDEAALAAWRDALVDQYKRGVLAPFEVRSIVPTSGTAFSVDINREVGKYRVKPEGAALHGVEVTGVELPGAHPKAIDVLAPMRELKVWPVKTNGQVVTDCHVEIAKATRAELCPTLPDLDRATSSVVTSELRVMAVCPQNVVLDELAVVWLSPGAPAAFTPVTSEPAEPPPASFDSGPGVRELVCTEGRTACLSMGAEGNFVYTKGNDALAVPPTDLAGFQLKGVPTGFVGFEHKPTGLRVLRSAIGTYHGIPPASQLRDFLVGGECLLWQMKPPAVKRYPERVDLGTLCLFDGAWAEGTYAANTLNGAVLQSVQSGRIDDVETRCKYTPAAQ